MLFSIFDVLRIYEALQIFFYKFLLKWGKNGDFESTIFFEAEKYYFAFESRLDFFSNGHIRNVVSTLPNIVKIDVENDNVILTLSNVVQFNVEIYNVVSTLLNVVNFNVDVHNVVSTLIWRCATSRRHINLKTTLNRRWNVCWDVFHINPFVLNAHFLYLPENIRHPYRFLMFSGGREKVHWEKMGKTNLFYIAIQGCI